MADPDLMFDLRLGLALGKSLGEVRCLPYPEVKLWRIFYLVEPWGFPDSEYRTAALLAQLHNVNVSKKRQAKPATYFMRDMPKKMLEAIRKKKREMEMSKQAPVLPDLSTHEGRAAATEHAVKVFEAVFGKRIERKDK